MGELVRKELKSFFASLSGYVVLVFFLLANGLFLWIIPGGYHIPASGLADMQAFFTLAPLLYLFSGSCSLYAPICRRKAYRYAGVTAYPPLTTWQIVGAKYLAGFLLVLFSILPTRLSGQFMVFSPAGRTYRCGRNYRFVYRVDFLIRHICGCRGLGFGFDRKSDYCFSLQYSYVRLSIDRCTATYV